MRGPGEELKSNPSGTLHQKRLSDNKVDARARGRMGQVDFLFLALVAAVFVVTGLPFFSVST